MKSLTYEARDGVPLVPLVSGMLRGVLAVPISPLKVFMLVPTWDLSLLEVGLKGPDVPKIELRSVIWYELSVD